MPRPCLWAAPALVLVVGLTGFPGAPLRAQTAVGDSAEFAAWRQVQKEDIDGLRKKFMALAKAVPADKLTWRPMEGTRSFREVFAHIAAEGNTETAMFGRPLPPGSLADRRDGPGHAESEHHVGRAVADDDQHPNQVLRT